MIKNIVTQHFQRYRERPPWSFCWRITIEGFVVIVVFMILLDLIFSIEERTDLDDLSTMALFICGVVLVPLIETLLLQSFPIFLARVLGAGFRGQVLVSTAVFASQHFISGVGAGIGAGIIGGFYSAFTYAHWRKTSRWTAFWTTTVSHSLHNLFVFIFLLLGGEF